jgi:hypothetical protein
MCQNDSQHFKRFSLVLDLLHQQSPSPQPLMSSAMNLHTPLSLSTIRAASPLFLLLMWPPQHFAIMSNQDGLGLMGFQF